MALYFGSCHFKNGSFDYSITKLYTVNKMWLHVNDITASSLNTLVLGFLNVIKHKNSQACRSPATSLIVLEMHKKNPDFHLENHLH